MKKDDKKSEALILKRLSLLHHACFHTQQYSASLVCGFSSIKTYPTSFRESTGVGYISNNKINLTIALTGCWNSGFGINWSFHTLQDCKWVCERLKQFLDYFFLSLMSFYVAYDVRISWDAVRGVRERRISCYISKDVSFHIEWAFYTFFLAAIHMHEILSPLILQFNINVNCVIKFPHRL